MPRAGLSQSIVVDRAARIADEVGYDHLTLAAVAEQFGVAVPSLYKHVEGLDDLRRRLAVQATAELGAAMEEAVARAPDRPLGALATAYREYALGHPGRYGATVRAPDPDHAAAMAVTQDVLDTTYRVLATYELGEDDLVDATRALRAALHGFVALEQAGGFGMPRDIDDSFRRLIDVFDSALRNWRSSETGT